MLCLHATQQQPVRNLWLSALASGREVEHRGLSPPQGHCKKMLHKYQRLLRTSSKDLDAVGSQASERPEMCPPCNMAIQIKLFYCSLYQFVMTINSKVPGFQQVCLLCVCFIQALDFSCKLSLALESRCTVPQDSACHYADQQRSPFCKGLYWLTVIAKECSNNIVSCSVLDLRVDTVIQTSFMKHKDLLPQHLLYLFQFGFTMKINMIFCSSSDLETEAATGQDIWMPLSTTRE